MKINYKNHPFLNEDNKEYVVELQRRIDTLKYIKGCSSIDDKLNKLLKYKNDSSYLQGVAELLMWFFCEKNKIDYFCDTKTNVKKNCDLSFSNKGIGFNIEVKSPQIDEHVKVYNELKKGKAVVQLNTPFRPLISKDNNDAIMQGVLEYIKKALESRNEEITFMTGLPIDNPLFEAIAKASEQLPQPNGKNVNIIFIPTTTEQMGKYIDYLKNPATGVFTKKFPGVQGKTWTLTKDGISNIAGAILTNAFEGYKKPSANNLEIEQTICLYIDNDNGDLLFEKAEKAFTDLFGFATDRTKNFVLDYVESKKEQIVDNLIKLADKDGNIFLPKDVLRELTNSAFSATSFFAHIKKEKSPKP